jgi:hypothetical protein
MAHAVRRPASDEMPVRGAPLYGLVTKIALPRQPPSASDRIGEFGVLLGPIAGPS